MTLFVTYRQGETKLSVFDIKVVLTVVSNAINIIAFAKIELIVIYRLVIITVMKNTKPLTI